MHPYFAILYASTPFTIFRTPWHFLDYFIVRKIFLCWEKKCFMILSIKEENMTMGFLAWLTVTMSCSTVKTVCKKKLTMIFSCMVISNNVLLCCQNSLEENTWNFWLCGNIVNPELLLEHQNTTLILAYTIQYCDTPLLKQSQRIHKQTLDCFVNVVHWYLYGLK